jgi:hypothetical protein
MRNIVELNMLLQAQDLLFMCCSVLLYACSNNIAYVMTCKSISTHKHTSTPYLINTCQLVHSIPTYSFSHTHTPIHTHIHTHTHAHTHAHSHAIHIHIIRITHDTHAHSQVSVPRSTGMEPGFVGFCLEGNQDCLVLGMKGNTITVYRCAQSKRAITVYTVFKCAQSKRTITVYRCA